MIAATHSYHPPAQVLLGWAGAQRDGALLKYAEVLAGRGYASVRSVQPLLVAFSPLPWLRRNWALALLRYLEERQLWPQRRLVLYAFSNGACWMPGVRASGHTRPLRCFVACTQATKPLPLPPPAACRRRVCRGAANADCGERSPVRRGSLL